MEKGAEMSTVTENVKKYVANRGINLSFLASKIGHSYDAIHASLGNLQGRNRDLRDDEFLDICKFLEVDPMMFATTQENQNEQN